MDVERLCYCWCIGVETWWRCKHKQEFIWDGGALGVACTRCFALTCFRGLITNAMAE
jgi:hypothetical protein